MCICEVNIRQKCSINFFPKTFNSRVIVKYESHVRIKTTSVQAAGCHILVRNSHKYLPTVDSKVHEQCLLLFAVDVYSYCTEDSADVVGNGKVIPVVHSSSEGLSTSMDRSRRTSCLASQIT